MDQKPKDYPEFLEKTEFKNPFSKVGVQRKYVALVIPLLSGEPVREVDMLRAAGVNLGEVSHRGYYSDYFRQFTANEILRFDRVHKLWHQGKNYWEYMGFLVKESCKNEVLRGKLASIFRPINSVAAYAIVDLVDNPVINEEE